MVIELKTKIGKHDDAFHEGSAKRGTASGVASLDASGHVPAGELALAQLLTGKDAAAGYPSLNADKNLQVAGPGMASVLAGQLLQNMASPKFLWMPTTIPTAEKEFSGNEHDVTYNGSMTSSDQVQKSLLHTADMDGVDDYINIPDSDDFSFGDGANDSAVTFCGVFNLIHTASWKSVIGKVDFTTGSTVREHRIVIDNTEIMYISFFDESAGVEIKRTIDTALSFGYHTYAITYDGAGGAAAANTIKIYIDGLLVASTAANNGAYVAMENLTTPLMLGARIGTGGTVDTFFKHNLGCQLIDGSEWSAATAWRVHQLLKGFYGL